MNKSKRKVPINSKESNFRQSRLLLTKPQEWSTPRAASNGQRNKFARAPRHTKRVSFRERARTWRGALEAGFLSIWAEKALHTCYIPGVSRFENKTLVPRGEQASKRGKRRNRVFCTCLGVGKFSTLQGSHVTSQSKLLAVQSLQIFLPLHDLSGDLALGLGVAHHALLQVGHVLQLVVLQHAIHTGHVSPAIVTFSELFRRLRRRSIFNPSALSPQRCRRRRRKKR